MIWRVILQAKNHERNPKGVVQRDANKRARWCAQQWSRHFRRLAVFHEREGTKLRASTSFRAPSHFANTQ